jgi:hypothetical protein
MGVAQDGYSYDRAELMMRTIEGLVKFAAITTLLVTSCANRAHFSSNGGNQPARTSPQKIDQAPAPIPVAAPTPLPTNAIVQGSFTVWADPPHPMEKQSYFIHVRVTLPKTVTTYTRQDLSGTLIGTDGYRQRINDPIMGFITQQFHFTPGSGSAELVMLVPGALQGIDDTLQVTSQLLHESQTVLVHFD